MKSMDKYIKVPLSDEDARSLKAGDYVYLTGTIYTARDAAHKRMQEALEQGEALPMEMKNNVIYYMDRHRREKEDRSALQDLPQPAVWISMHRTC